MLVLTRRKDERIIIDPGGLNIVVAVCKILDGGKVQIGIEAPTSMAVHRAEVVERITWAKRESNTNPM